ncbi:hypothetical protein DSM03_102287 [Leeuwenhoekiella aestuarii]|uniref:Uncharacterized protein n=1 Tax=Leeuwenhoekiella aestuarii TaxID=2249426 RepID=A0A4Q0NVU1_9FLAO|nr:hypothetical protein [Leeuwenhoekiella aestuarii]RXG15482.1 hypothetical protein DSM04_103371 [Leeuwenhoekiella aestuarii]RXG17411.1 hypothetical protein DSM03_102287 [Leeuwenhoekiella aestuarii]
MKSLAIPFIENFDSPTDFDALWKDDSSNSPKSYSIESNKLKITTRAGSQDRVKRHTRRKDFGVGNYSWRIFVSRFEEHARSSIGAFLYHSGKQVYEFDFEIGSGKPQLRAKLNAENDEAVVYCTSQSNPFSSEKFKVKMNAWSDFKISLADVGGKYLIKWYLNNKLLKTLQTEVNTKMKFSAYCSLENLSFMGTEWPTQEHYVLFDKFTFRQ